MSRKQIDHEQDRFCTQCRAEDALRHGYCIECFSKMSLGRRIYCAKCGGERPPNDTDLAWSDCCYDGGMPSADDLYDYWRDGEQRTFPAGVVDGQYIRHGDQLEPRMTAPSGALR